MSTATRRNPSAISSGAAPGFACILCNGFGQGREFFTHNLRVQRLIPLRAKDAREMIRVQFAQHDVAVGHGQRATAPVAGWAGIRTSAFGANLKTPILKLADRATAGGDRMNIHHRRTHPHAGHLGFKGSFVIARVVAHIGGCAAHIKTDQLRVPRGLSGFYHADNAPGWPGQDGILALKQLRIGQPARGLQ